MQYGYEEIIEYFKENQDANFVAFMRTAWHSYGATASLIKLSEKENLKGILLASAEDYNNDTPLIDNKTFSILDNYNIEYDIACQKPVNFPKTKWKLLKFKLSPIKYFANHQKGFRKIYVINPLRTADLFIPILKKAIPQSEIISVVTDEGLGSYFRTPYNWAVELYKNTHKKIRFVESLFTQALSAWYKKRAKKENELIDFTLLTTNADGYVANGEIPKYYNKVITDGFDTKKSLKEYENSVIISAQLYYETGQIKNDYDLTLYKKVVDAFKQRGINVVFKPHPRDKNINRYSCLGCYVDNENTMSQEKIISSLNRKPLAIVSFTSTSLVTSNLFYGIKSFSLNNCVEKNMLESNLVSEFKGFNKRFGNIVTVANDVDQLVYLCLGR